MSHEDRKRQIRIFLLSGMLALLWVSHTVSVPQYAWGSASRVAFPNVGSGETFRTVAVLYETSAVKTQWMREKPLILRMMLIPPSIPGVISNDSEIFPDSEKMTLRWEAGVFKYAKPEGNPDGINTSQDVPSLLKRMTSDPALREGRNHFTRMGMEFDLRKKKVTLLQTGEVLPFHSGFLYCIQANEAFEPVRFWALRDAGDIPGLNPEAGASVRTFFEGAFRDESPADASR